MELVMKNCLENQANETLELELITCFFFFFDLCSHTLKNGSGHLPAQAERGEELISADPGGEMWRFATIRCPPVPAAVVTVQLREHNCPSVCAVRRMKCWRGC